MKRIHDLGTDATQENIRAAWDSFSDQKHKRKNIRQYERNLDDNLARVLHDLTDESWYPSDYIRKDVMERKHRTLAKVPFLTMFLKLLPSVRTRPACMTTSHGSVLPSVRIWDRRLCSVRYGTNSSRTRRMNVITTCRWMLTIIFR